MTIAVAGGVGASVQRAFQQLVVAHQILAPPLNTNLSAMPGCADWEDRDVDFHVRMVRVSFWRGVLARHANRAPLR
jgi:hypothetical protein